MKVQIAPRFLAPVVAAAVIVVAAVGPSMSRDADERSPEALDVAATTYTCPSGDGLSVLAGQVSPGDAVSARALPDDTEITDLEDPSVWRSVGSAGEAVAVTQTGAASGAVGFTSGIADGSGDGLVVAPCATRADDAWFTGLGAVDGHESQLVLVNPAGGPAVVRLSAWGESGALSIAGDDTITLDAGEVRRIVASDLAAAETTMAVRVQRLRGEATAQVLDAGSADVRGSELMTASAAPARELVLAAADGEGDRALLLTNPGEETANVRVSALGADNGTYVLEGLDDVAVDPGTVARVELPAVDVPLLVNADRPVTAASRRQGENDLALGTSLTPLEDRAAVIPVVGDTRLTLASPGRAGDATVEAFDADMSPLGEQALDIPEGGSVALGAGEIADGASYLLVTGPGMYAQARYAEGDGVALMPVLAAPTAVLAPHVSWGGRWH
ncbi:hypothetical protein BHE97_12735 [Aeromicrobium sp. PE09-221]|uniref:DUF5719 family protein n=1 Tax=Aeromicrobium sp. PE09-221 TaxID=1898043 RepID=UPI000B3EA2C6|nr:DUF5719 family protein [Aeromicrobium sp. PE09-221]OUZ08543.1 hypothetical protein BHE97_12735 [Aeromicrobium sp. PE09-221]